jgi:hypothetical protein
MNKIYFEVNDDVVIKYTPMSVMMGENTYKAEIVMTKEIFQKCYKKWVESKIGCCDNRDAIKVIERSLCDSCKNRECIFQSGIVRNHCNFYKTESEE